jgi:hypothetical protein
LKASPYSIQLLGKGDEDPINDNEKIGVIIRSLCCVIKGEGVILSLAGKILEHSEKGRGRCTRDGTPIYQSIIRNLDLALNIEESMVGVRLKLKKTGTEGAA